MKKLVFSLIIGASMGCSTVQERSTQADSVTSNTPKAKASEKRIYFEVGGTLVNQDVQVYLIEAGGTKKIIDRKGGSNSDGLWASRRISGNADIIEFIVDIDGDVYTFEVKARDGISCGLGMHEKTIILNTNMDADPSSLRDSETDRIESELNGRIRFGEGFSKGNNVQFYVNSALQFDEIFESERIPFSKTIEFPVSAPVFNMKVVIDGLSYSFDIDISQGQFITFERTSRQILISQYLEEESVPNLF